MIIAIDILLGLVSLLAWSAMLYKPFFKRFWDIVLSSIAIVVLLPLLLFLTILGTIKMKGNPFFTQLRPGKKGKDGKERIFKLIKFRSMTCEKDKNGNLLPDEKRLTNYGKKLRATSLDELPELLNILKGDMSIVGPRPLAVKYLPFYTEEERHRHDIRPGLTGLAQIMGRNNLSWEEKFAFDIKYLTNLSLLLDIRIIFESFISVLKHDGIGQGEEKPVSLHIERAGKEL